MARYGKILVLAALAGLLVADSEAGPATPGITVTRPVPSAMESLSDVQALAPFRQQPTSDDRHIPFRRIPRAADTAIFTPQLSLSIGPADPLAAPVPMAPALDDSFAGLANTDGIAISGGRDVIPPDTMGAAGPLHLVSFLNSQFGVFEKATGLMIPPTFTLRGFWISLDNATDTPSQNPFDPKVLFDTNSGRFVAATLGANRVGNNNAPPSRVMIAMSATSDPTGIWFKVAIRADNNADGTIDGLWADYPGLGVDANNIYVTANMFTPAGSFRYSKVWVVSKNEALLNGGSGALTWTEFRDPRVPGDTSPPRDTIQPAHTFGTPGVEYFIYEGGPNQLLLERMDNTTGTPRWNLPVAVTVAQYASLSSLPGVPQAGIPSVPNGIDAGDTRLLNAIFRNGSLWTTHHVAVGGKIEVAWYQINPVTGIVQSQGRISDLIRWYFFPSIAVNASGDVGVGFSGSSPIDFASGYYTARRSADPAGTMQPPSLLKTGVAPYFKTLSGTENRWGDFSATVVDPSDNLTFWTLQEYAAAPSLVDGRSMWGTWWGKFRPPAIASPTLTATAVSMTQVNLSWTLPEGQTGFRVERRQLPGGDFPLTPLAVVGPNVTTFTDNTGVAGTTYAYRVRALSPPPGPDSFSNEATATTVSPPPAPPVGGGGGGGGCGVSNGKTREGDFSPPATVLIMLLPAGIMFIRRRFTRNSR